MNVRPLAVIAGSLVLAALSGAPEAAAAAVTIVKPQAAAQSLLTPVHYRCVVRRCGPYRCVWINRCRW